MLCYKLHKIFKTITFSIGIVNMAFLQIVSGGIVRKEARTVFGPKGDVLSHVGKTVGLAFVRSDTPNRSFTGIQDFGELRTTPKLGDKTIVAVESSTGGNRVRLEARAESGRPDFGREQFSGPMGLGIILQGDQFAAIIDVKNGTKARVTPGDSAGVGTVVINSSVDELVINLK